MLASLALITWMVHESGGGAQTLVPRALWFGLFLALISEAIIIRHWGVQVFNGHTISHFKLVWHLREDNCAATQAQFFDAWLGATTVLVAHAQGSILNAMFALRWLLSQATLLSRARSGPRERSSSARAVSTAKFESTALACMVAKKSMEALGWSHVACKGWPINC